MATLILLLLATLLPIFKTEYIPPGPRYTCPKETDKLLLYPCVCEKGTDAGLYIRCENAGLAVLSVGIGNIAGLGLPVEKLVLKECKISHLFGPLFHRSTIRVIQIEDTPIKTIDAYAFAGVNRTLQELYMANTQIEEFPKEAFKILSNITILSIDGHKITSLGKDIFAGSEAIGRIEKLHLSNGLITDVAVEAFLQLKKLKTLDLHGNRLSTLKRSQFKGLRDTEVLDISYNNITKLDGSHIGDLTKLGWCNVSHNLIGEIPRGMFARNTVLKVLHLDNNKIKKLDTNSFRGMRFLRRLYLQDNMISDVGRGTFSAVTRIGTVDLARNMITKVDYQMFQQVKYAEIINLAENKITLIETQAFTDLYLAVVNISHNEITTIEKGAFQNCNNLTTLDLSFNKLESVTKYAFDENSYAGEFNVAYNLFKDLSQVPIQNMTGIRLLNASHNNIESIPRNTFPKLYELHTIDVSYNNLTEIYNAVFQTLFSIRYLYLDHNSLTHLKPATFGTLPTILELRLSHNKLTEVSRGSLSKLSSCRVLDISYNYIETLPQIPISLSLLNIAHNNISQIRDNSWPSMNSLLHLNLSSNRLSDTLSTETFLNLLTLQTLDLSENGISVAPWQPLTKLSSLQYLYLQDNNITTLSKSAFGILPTLFHLDLSNNHISSIEKQTFTGLQQLQDLSLKNNSLLHIPNEAFKGLVALRKLDLSYNSLDKIDNKTHGLLEDCLSLESINLSHNNVGFLTKLMFPVSPWFPYRLREVDLSHNSIPVLTYDLTYGAKTLKMLNLSGNSINDIRNNVLGNLTSLEVLDLSNNQLTDLISRTSAGLKLHFPENITKLYLQNNRLQVLPVDNIVKAEKLSYLDVRNNKLSGFQPEVVRKIKRGMEVYFEGNNLKCDCYTRPLKHLLNHLTPTQRKTDTKYKNITCNEPPSLKDEYLLSIDEERLVCSGNINKTKDNGEFDFTTEPDLAFRDIQYSQTSIYAHWFVLSADDIADFFIYIRDSKSKVHFSQAIAYNLRSISMVIDNDLSMSLKNGGDFDICIQAKLSNDLARKWFASQCQKVPNDFTSWPKKLSVDKRLSRKKVRYSWFGNNVMALLSDSILITMCIFVGVCFRRLSDYEL